MIVVFTGFARGGVAVRRWQRQRRKWGWGSSDPQGSVKDGLLYL